MTLVEIQEQFKFNTDKHRMAGKKRAHTYLPEYDKLFEQYKDDTINILEIGVLDGSSLKLWSQYFTNSSNIYGIDCYKRITKAKVERNVRGYNNVELYKVDSVGPKGYDERKKFFNNLKDQKFHIIIDDGDHKPESQVKTFNNFINHLHDNGTYIIEDIWDWDKNEKGKLNSKDKRSQTGLQYIQQNIPDIEIINMNHQKGIYNDNVLGIYKK
jgi:hypothetical protein